MATKVGQTALAPINDTFAHFKAWAGDVTAAAGTGTGIAAALYTLGFTKLADTYTSQWDNGSTIGAGALPNLTAGGGGNLFGTTFATTTNNLRAAQTAAQFKGAWSSGANYSIGDIVTDNAAGQQIVYIATAAGVNHATTNTSFWSPYWMEIWEFVHAGLTNIYIKLEYGCGSTSASNPQLSMQLGIAYVANSGVLSGNTTSVEKIFDGTASSASTFNCAFYGNGQDVLGVMMFRDGTSALPGFFCVERSVSGQVASAPVYTSQYMTYICCPGAAAQWRQTSLFTTGIVQTSARMNNAATVSLFVTAATLIANGITPALPVFPLPGWVGNPMTVVMAFSSADSIEGATTASTVYGAAHNYLTTKSTPATGFGNGAAGPYGYGMRFE